MNAAEACVTDLKSAKAVYRTIRKQNPHYQWMHVTKEAFSNIQVDMGVFSRTYPGNTVSMVVDCQEVHITYKAEVIRSHYQYQKLVAQGFRWLEPDKYPLPDDKP
jgi:hypothetical protein